MRTRCPQCATVFRITPEQLRLRAGKVRCGHCQAVFNALDSLIEEPVSAAVPPPPAPEPAKPAPGADYDAPPTPLAAQAGIPPGKAASSFAPPAGEEADAGEESAASGESPHAGPAAFVPTGKTGELPATETGEGDLPTGHEWNALPAPDESPDESPEESTEAARAAGLVAARELADAPGYSRWAAGAVSASPFSGLEPEMRQRVTWPFALAAALLALALAAQASYHFRSDIALRLPASAGIYAGLGIDIPLPREAERVSIEASDLQSDPTRGLLLLQATLRNRAEHAQDWPALELTLTDARDTVVARRVLAAADYLPPKADPTAFAAHGETAVRLWIEAKGVDAAGYRLYVFYP